MDWIAGEALLLPTCGLLALVIFSAATEDMRKERRMLLFRRCVVWILTIVLAGTFLVNAPMGTSGQLGKGNKVIRVGNVFAGFPARSFLMPAPGRCIGEVKLSKRNTLRLDFTYAVASRGKQQSVAAVQRYFDTVVVPYGSATSYFTTTLNRAGIDSLMRDYAQARASGIDSSTAVRPVIHAVWAVASQAAMTTNKVSLTERRSS